MKKILYTLILLFLSISVNAQFDRFIEASRQQFANEGGGGGAIPVFEQSGTSATSLVATLAIPFPTTVNADDILVVQILRRNAGLTYLVPTGWTEIYQSTSTTAGSAFWKRATGSESGSETFTYDDGGTNTDLNFGVMHRFSGCVTTGTPYEDNQNQGSSSQVTHDILAMTSTATNRLAIGLVYVGDNRSIVTDVVDYTNRFSEKTSVGNDGWHLMYDYGVPTISTTPLNTIDFDQNETGGTINFLLIPQ